MNLALTGIYKFICLFLLAFAVFFLCMKPLAESEYGPKSDEGYYYKYASLVNKKGLPAFNELLTWYTADSEARKHPAPWRIGYILLSAGLFKLLGPSFSILGLISQICFFIFLWINFHYIRKYFNESLALITVVLLASSPLMLGLSRRGLIDSPINLLWGLSIWLFLDVLRSPSRFKYLSFLLILTISISFKEMSLILIPFFVVYAFWAKLRDDAAISTLKILGICLLPLGLMAAFYAAIYQGGGASLTKITQALLTTHFMEQHPNPYAIYYSSGFWFRYIVDFILLSPIISLLFIAFLGYGWINRQAIDRTVFYLSVYFIYVYTVLNLMPHSKVVRFVVNLEMVMTVFAGLFIVELLKRVTAEKQARWLVLIVLGIFVYNWTSFLDIFYSGSLLDPISLHLLKFRQLIPFEPPY